MKTRLTTTLGDERWTEEFGSVDDAKTSVDRWGLPLDADVTVERITEHGETIAWCRSIIAEVVCWRAEHSALPRPAVARRDPA